MSVIAVTAENYASEVAASEKKVLLDFWAPWCGPCRMVSPLVDQIAEERSDIVVGKVKVDENMELAVQFGVSSIPMLAIVEGGQVKRTQVGAMPKDKLVAFIDAE